MYRVGEVTKVRVQQARREIGGGDGGMRSTLRPGVQSEQADKRVGGATRRCTGRVIRCGLLQTRLPEVRVGLSRKTKACSLGEVLRPFPNFRTSSRYRGQAPWERFTDLVDACESLDDAIRQV